MSRTPKTQKLRRSTLVIVAVLAVMSIAVPASAGSATQISGGGVTLGVPPGPGDCNGQPSEWTLELLSGSLQGCWYTDAINSGAGHPSGTYQERGEETFVGGYFDEAGNLARTGSFSATYNFTGKFDESGAEIFGRCQHPIVVGSGTGVFAGVTGRVDFKDVDVVNGILEFRGHIKFPNCA